LNYICLLPAVNNHGKYRLSTLKFTYLVPFILVLGVVFVVGCNGSIFHPKLSEGEIEYDITYPIMDPDNVMADFMPKSMTLKFKDSKFATELTAGMGMFKTNFVSDCKTHKMSHLVKMINKKYSTTYDDSSIDILNNAYENFTVVETNETKIIAGYECKKAWVIFTDVNMPSFELFYTSDISIEDPNWSLPFKDIDGVLMEYDMKRNGIIMRLSAVSVSKIDIDDDAFLIPEEYEALSIKHMEIELKKLFDTFNY
jgi:GLPGLI family protein